MRQSELNNYGVILGALGAALSAGAQSLMGSEWIDDEQPEIAGSSKPRTIEIFEEDDEDE